jgi:signal transduction histidine kinase
MKYKQSSIIYSVIILIATSLIVTALIIHKSENNKLHYRLDNEIKIINNTLSDFFTNIWRVSEDKGRKISNNSAINNDIINKYFKRQFSYISESTSFIPSLLWPRFYWLNLDHKISVTSHRGILKNPVSINLEPYQFLAMQNPWNIYFSKTHREADTNKKILKGIIAINNDEQEYVGSIIIRFEINKIINRLNLSLANKEANYLILNQNLDHILSANNLEFQKIKEDKELQDIFTKEYNFNQIINLDNPVIIGDLIYNKAIKLPNYPFLILSGYNKNQHFQNIVISILKYILKISIICIAFILIILWINKIFNNDISRSKKIIKKYRLSSNKLRNEKRRCIHSKESSDIFFSGIIGTIEDPILAIKQDIKKLLQSETQEIIITANNKLDIYNNMLDKLLIIESFSAQKLSFENVNVSNIIEEAINHHQHITIHKNIKIDFNKKNNIQDISVDKLRLLQIISNIIYISLLDSPKSRIKININNSVRDGKKFLKINFIGDGNGLSEEDKNLLSSSNKKKSLYNNELQDIVKLVELHEGILNSISNYNQGTEIILLLPYDRNDDNPTKKEKIKMADNVIMLPRRR